MHPKRRYREFLTLVAIWLVGVAFIALLPPWEGYDETAHYSYAQQIADTGSLPRYGEARISRDVEDYGKAAPLPYKTTVPFDANGGFTYEAWFRARPAGSASAAHRAPEFPRAFSPGVAANWQAQHPFLYYLGLAPLIKLSAAWSWAQQLFLLRLVSWSLAWLGFVLAFDATCRYVAERTPVLAAAASSFGRLWPLLFLTFFPMFGRIGNDGLVMFLTGSAWWLLLRWDFQLSRPRAALLGALLGFGALSKVTFLPMTVGLLAWYAWRHVRSREHSPAGPGAILVVTGVFLAVCGWWYADRFLTHGNATGLEDLIQYSQQDVSPLAALGKPMEILRGLATMALTFLWGGTWSSAYPPPAIFAPQALVLLAVAILTLLALKQGRNAPLGNAQGAALALLVPTGAALIYYLLLKIAATGSGVGAPGWYLQVLYGPLLLLALPGWGHLLALRAARLLEGGIFAVATLTLATLMTLQVGLFSGCLRKVGSSNRYQVGDWSCLADLGTLHDRMASLAMPKLAAAATAAAVLALLCAVAADFRRDARGD